MKKHLLLIILSIVCIQDIYANHTKGGWMYYEYLGPGIVDPSKNRYKIGLNFYMLCSSNLLDNPINFSFYSGSSPYIFLQDVSVPINTINSTQNCTLQACHPCISPIPSICYKIVNYETIVELAPTPDGYIISKQRCCRVTGIANLTAPSNNVGETWTISIPGTATGVPNSDKNSSPKFIFNDTAIVCGTSPFSINFTAVDPNGDSLVYSFCNALDGGSQANVIPTPASPPPYASVPYIAPYSGSNPIGAGATINPVTGVISGIAPSPGEYVICVCVAEYRNGIHFADSRKELHLYVADCIPLVANPNFTPITCDGFTVNFQDNSYGNPTNYYWNFGNPASGTADTSTLPNPTHTFTDTGVFNITLKVSIGGNCVDSIIKPIKVYPGFYPGFITSPALCVNAPIQFTDTTKTKYGFVNSWSWNFGVPPPVFSDTSHLQNPVYTYNLAGSYDVQLIVSNSKGCIDTLIKTIVINDNPVVTLFPHDTTYCGLDSLQLTATGTGSFNWVPLTYIIGANTATPIVFPPVPTKYFVTLTSAVGCKSSDSLNLNPKNDLTNTITANPPTICAEDTLTLTGSSNYINNLSWQWTPAATLATPNQIITTAYPLVNTTYTLITHWGNHCVAVATQNITVKPLAIPNAGPDTYVCIGGKTSVQLNASGGNTYQWSPVTGLSNPNIANPIASPVVPTYYVVAVGVNGCARLKTDTVFVNVGSIPALTVMNDTLICNIDTIAISTTGTGFFTWSPNYNISSITAPNPLVSPAVPTWYYVRLTDAVGCFNTDSVFINVKNKVTLNVGPDTTICRTDGFFLNASSDGLHYKWTPATYLNYDSVISPYALPLANITYQVTANIGKCVDTKSLSVKVVPYPPANAGPDVFVCYGFPAQLNATGGSHYVWNPVTFLNNRFLPNPIAIDPTANIRYIVTVTDTLGCPKAVKDTVWVNVYPKLVIHAGPTDTSVVLGEPLYLNAGTGNTYLWTPATWLNNPNIGNPISLPMNNIQYIVQATTPAGCIGFDTINVQLFRVDPDLYVPTAFTPNGDGLNDVLRPIMLGMKQLTYFRVYNRFGQLLFSTNQIGKGWDGTFGGKGQDPGTYVWMAEGVNYKGQVKFKKGYAVLIR